MAIAKSTLPDIVFLEQRLPDIEGECLLQPLTAPEIGAKVVMMTAYVELDKAIQAMRNGVTYFFPKPLDLGQVAEILTSMEAGRGRIGSVPARASGLLLTLKP